MAGEINVGVCPDCGANSEGNWQAYAAFGQTTYTGFCCWCLNKESTRYPVTLSYFPYPPDWLTQNPGCSSWGAIISWPPIPPGA